MDMNWQAMLREAADASFEKNIEALAAADNDAYSCVDLSQSKIWELSKKDFAAAASGHRPIV